MLPQSLDLEQCPDIELTVLQDILRQDLKLNIKVGSDIVIGQLLSRDTLQHFDWSSVVT